MSAEALSHIIPLPAGLAYTLTGVMATAKNWQGGEVEEQQNPVPPFSKFVAIRDFPGKH